jgi:hypothetical protein
MYLASRWRGNAENPAGLGDTARKAMWASIFSMIFPIPMPGSGMGFGASVPILKPPMPER